MKIAFLCPHDLGIQVFVGPFARALAGESGCELHAFAPKEFDYDLTRLCDLGVRIDYVHMPRFISPASDIRYVASIARRLRSLRPDAVVCFTTKPNVYGSVAARIAGVKTVVCAVRGLGAPFQPPRTVREKVVQRIVIGLYKTAGRISSTIWFTNVSDRERFVSEGIVDQRRTVLTANGVDTREFAPGSVSMEKQSHLRSELGIAPGAQVVIMVARLSWAKGVREFVDAARSIRQRRPGTEFILVGPVEDRHDGVPSEYLEQVTSEGTVKWLGFRSDTRDLYALADVAVLPSYYKEGGYPRALLEPMAMGKAVIGCDTPDCRGPVEEGVNGFLVPPRDCDALVSAVLRILEDSELRTMFGKASRARIEAHFDDRSIVVRILELVRTTVVEQQSADGLSSGNVAAT